MYSRLSGGVGPTAATWDTASTGSAGGRSLTVYGWGFISRIQGFGGLGSKGLVPEFVVSSLKAFRVLRSGIGVWRFHRS